MFRLEVDTGARGLINKSNSRTFYVRTYSLLVSQLRDIITDWEANNHYHEEADTWINMMTTLRSNDTVYLRYVGATEKTNPHQRLRNQLIAKFSGFVARFHEIIHRLFPMVLDASVVYEFSEAEQMKDGGNSPPAAMPLDIKRLLISLNIGRPTHILSWPLEENLMLFSDVCSRDRQTL
jgi:hypothetical protein